MLSLMQLIAYMLNHLEYTDVEVCQLFESLEREEIDVLDLLDSTNFETLSKFQLERLNRAIPKWKSAIAVVRLQNQEQHYSEVI